MNDPSWQKAESLLRELFAESADLSDRAVSLLQAKRAQGVEFPRSTETAEMADSLTKDIILKNDDAHTKWVYEVMMAMPFTREERVSLLSEGIKKQG